jgi:hypothetical protein
VTHFTAWARHDIRRNRSFRIGVTRPIKWSLAAAEMVAATLEAAGSNNTGSAMIRKRDRVIPTSDHTMTLIFLGLLAFAALAGVVGMFGHPTPAPLTP